MGNISLIIDGKSIKAHEGTSVLEAARNNGIEIPSLCYMKELIPSGSCRMCVVQVKGMAAYKSACTLEVREGMEITTSSPQIDKVRRTNLELLLWDHDYDCSVCHQNGECRLQDLGYRYQIGIKLNRRFDQGDHSYHARPDGSSPVLIYRPDKCIRCGICIGSCRDLQGKGVLDFVERGMDAYPSPEYVRWADSSCDGCGECVQNCPTGALREKPLNGQYRRMDLDRIVRTSCGYCGVGCQMDLWIKDNRVVRIRGAEKDTLPNRGRLCVKGRFGYEFLNSPERLTKPLIRESRGFREASWEEALTLAVEKFSSIKKESGPRALAGLASARCTNEENYIFQKFIRSCFGTNAVDHCARLCHAPTVAGLVRAFGSGAMTNPIGDLAGADCILITGANVSETHPVTATYICNAQKRGARIIVIDPRKIDLANRADLHLQQKPGTDVAWINGLIHIIMKEGWTDPGFIDDRTENIEALRKSVASFTPERVEEISGIPAETLREAAEIYACSEKSAIVFAMGITQHITGTDNVLSLANLAMVCGHVGRESTGVNPLRGQNNVQGACDLGTLPNVYPGYQRVDSPEIREKFHRAWAADNLSDEPGLTVVEMMRAAHCGELRGLYIMGENPMLSDPHLSHVEESLTNLDFLVVQDIFLTETALLADIVLPAAAFAEKEGTFTNSGRRVQRVRKGVEPPGEAREDWDIICDLSSRMGFPMSYDSAESIMDEIASLTPQYGGISYDRLNSGALQWPCPDSSHPGTPYLHEGAFSRGRGRFHPVDFIPPAEQPDREYPFILTTGRMLFHYHTGTMTRRSKPLNTFAPGAYAEVHPSDLDALGIRDGESIGLRTRRGRISVSVRSSGRVSPGVVFVPFHFAESPANALTNDELDPKSKIPELKVAACRIEKDGNL